MKKKIPPLKNLIVDMDGVLWHGETPVPGLADFFETLHTFNIRFILATNNASKIAADYVEKLARFHVHIPAWQILTSAEATAHYLRGRFPENSRVYVVGDTGLSKAMIAEGFQLVESDGFIDPAIRVDIVVVGMTPHVCYPNLASAAHLINKGALFVGTNPDVTFPTEIGPLPGAGSILAFLETATDVKPLIIGKPNRPMFEEALVRLGASSDETAMVGDRLNTDIAGGHNAGLKTILLLSGISNREQLETAGTQPDWIFSDLRELNRFLQEG